MGKENGKSRSKKNIIFFENKLMNELVIVKDAQGIV